MKKGGNRKRKVHKVWQLQEAKAKFSKLVDDAIRDGYQTITRNGEVVAIVVSQKDFEYYRKPEGTLIDFFNRAPFPDVDLDLSRDKDSGRDTEL